MPFAKPVRSSGMTLPAEVFTFCVYTSLPKTLVTVNDEFSAILPSITISVLPDEGFGFAEMLKLLATDNLQLKVIESVVVPLLPQLFLAVTPTLPVVVPKFTTMVLVFCPDTMVLPVGTCLLRYFYARSHVWKYG